MTDTSEFAALTGDSKRVARILRRLLVSAIALSALGFIVAGIVFWRFSKDLPRIITVADYRPATVTQVIGAPPPGSKEGAVLGEFSKERRYVIPYEKIPQIVVRAFVAAEDDTFFHHPGINVLSILRATIANFRAGQVVQGGSTITQQVAKSLLLTPEKSFVRKIKEVILANRIEHNLTKEQILYLYLNQIYLGHGAYGVQAASKTYFGKDISQVNLAEAAILGGMPQAPGKYSPNLNPKKAKDRQLYVLRRMFENGFISQAQMNEAAATPVRVYQDEDQSRNPAIYLVEHLRRYLLEKYGEKAVYEDGLTVTSPASLELAAASRRSLREGLRAIDKRTGYRGPIKRLGGGGEQIEAYLKEQRKNLIRMKTGFDVLMPDGRLDFAESMRLMGLQSDLQLLDPDEIYEAVVLKVDDARKSAEVAIGALKAELPFSTMKWARPNREGQIGQEPAAPSRVVSRGDVILVKLMEGSADKGPPRVQLEQHPLVQGALFSLDVATGNVLAIQGGYDYAQSEFNRATQALRQPGSAFKPIIYSAAIEKGYTPATVIVDSPLVYDDGEEGKWKPTNFEEKFYGDTTFRQALIKSRNVPTIKIVQSIQIPFLIDYARRLGITSQFNQDLSISLGSATVSLESLTGVYAVYPRLGRKVVPVFFQKILNRDGRVLEEKLPQTLPSEPRIAPPPEVEPAGTPVPGEAAAKPSQKVSLPSYPPAEDPDQLIDPRVAYVMTHLMNEVVNYGTGYEAKSLGRPAAGKTGTTNEYVDAWFMGFTPQIVTGVWVGYDNQRTLGSGETGARAALPIWLSFMQEAVKPYPPADFTIPPGIVFASIDPNNGKLASANSSNSTREAFIEGTQPARSTGDATGSGAATQSEFFKEDTE